MKLPLIILLSGALAAGVAVAQDTTSSSSQSGAKQDMKDAGNATKDAGKDVGHATAKGAKAVGHGTAKGAKKVGHATKKVFSSDDTDQSSKDGAKKSDQKPVQ